MRIAKVAALDNNSAQACSSVGEHHLDTVGVGGSIPPMPTIKKRTLGGSFSTPAIERCRAKPASAHAKKAGPSDYPVRPLQKGGGSESRAIHSAGCYSAQPLNPQRSTRTLLRFAVPASTRGEFLLSETMNRE